MTTQPANAATAKPSVAKPSVAEPSVAEPSPAAPCLAAAATAEPTPRRPAPQPIAADIEAGRTFLRDDGWQDQLEGRVRGGIRAFIEALIEAELAEALGRARYKRLAPATPAAGTQGLGDEEIAAASGPPKGTRNGRRARTVMGTFGRIEISVPRARIEMDEGAKTTEWKTKVLARYQRRTKEIDALIASAYLAGTNTRRVGRALGTLFGGPAISKSVVSRVWRKIKADWDNWNKRDLGNDDIIRLILDGTNVKVRLDR